MNLIFISVHFLILFYNKQNIFVTKQGDLKLGDLGLVKTLDIGKSAIPAGTVAGTLCYMAPEVINGEEIKCSSDIWSLGCVLYEMIELKSAVCYTNIKM